jgi:hypothetical protein
MRWLTENIQVLIAVAGVIAWWFNQRARAKRGEAADFDGDGNPEVQPGAPASPLDLEEAERTRRIQEEMRRRREQRAASPAMPTGAPQTPPARQAPPVMSAPPPVFQDPVAEAMKEFAKRFAPVEVAPPPPLVDQQALERQRQLEERYRALEAEKRLLERRAAALAVTSKASVIAATEQAHTGYPRGAEWLAELRNHSNARKAILVSEILAKPVGLR